MKKKILIIFIFLIIIIASLLFYFNVINNNVINNLSNNKGNNITNTSEENTLEEDILNNSTTVSPTFTGITTDEKQYPDETRKKVLVIKDHYGINDFLAIDVNDTGRLFCISKENADFNIEENQIIEIKYNGIILSVSPGRFDKIYDIKFVCYNNTNNYNIAIPADLYEHYKLVFNYYENES